MKRSSASAQAQNFASIDDLLIQVFVRIPLKQVSRFKLVSKHWNSIISDPKLHLSLRKPEPAAGLIFNCRIIVHHDMYNPYESYILYFNQPRTTPAQELRKHRGDEVLHSCNGLLLRKSGFRYHIYDTITKKTSNLGFFWARADIIGIYLACNPFESCHYKIVCVVGLGGPWFSPQSCDRFKIEVYSSKTGSWRKHGEPFSATVDFIESGVYWKGAIHWVSLTKAGKSIYFNPAGKDNDRMLPTVMPSPPILEDAYRRLYQFGAKQSPWYKERNYHFGESCGHLNFIDACRSAFAFNVYEMKTDYSEWFVKYRVDLSNVVVRGSLFSICTLVRGLKDDDSFMVLRVGKKFIRCNLVDKTCQTIFECEGNTPLEEELLGLDGEIPLHYIHQGANENVDGVWYTEEEGKIQERARGFYHNRIR